MIFTVHVETPDGKAAEIQGAPGAARAQRSWGLG